MAGLLVIATLLFPSASLGDSRPSLTVADGAYSYIRFEKLLGSMPRDPERLAPLQKKADLAVGALFGRDIERALRLLDQAVLTEMIQAEPAITHLAAAGLQVRPEGTPITNLRLTSRYPLKEAKETPYKYMLRVRSPEGQLQWQHPLTLPASSDGSWDLDFPVQLGNYDLIDEPGPIDISLLCQDGVEIPIGQAHVYHQRPSQLRQSQQTELTNVSPLPSQLQRSASRFAARNRQLRDNHHPKRLADHLLNRSQLAKQLAQEIASLKAGIDPYLNATGDRWFLLESERGDLPYRVYAPEKTTGPTQEPLPVVIALHGMGGNEHLFMEGYGGGALKRLADEHQFLLVSPRTYELAQSAVFFDALIGDIEDMYSIDPDRIYLIGHSLGAMTTMTLADQRPDSFAAICAIAGDGRTPQSQLIPPTLAFLAEDDWMVPANAAKQRIQQAQESGANIRSKIVPAAGHLLVVYMVLPDAITWLMSQNNNANK